VDVGQHAARRDGDAAEEFVELVVVADGQDQVTRRDALLLVVAARVARELEHLGRHVLDHGRQVDGAAGAVALGEAHVAQGAADAGHREGEAGLGRLGYRLLLGLAATTLDHGLKLGLEVGIWRQTADRYPTKDAAARVVGAKTAPMSFVFAKFCLK